MSLIGRSQRRQVWKVLKLHLQDSSEILEINCGTGEDAFHIASLGHQVLATDISDEMIGICRQKYGHNFPNLSFVRAGFQELDQYLKVRSFDLIFSNFGGLNCISPEETKSTIPVFFRLLKPRGRLFLVYMNRNCVWEKLYYRLKGKPGQAVRRHYQGPVQVRVGESYLDIWYYSPEEIKKLYLSYFRFVRSFPIGLFVPPTFLEHFFNRHKSIFYLMEIGDNIFGFPALAGFADHFAVLLSRH